VSLLELSGAYGVFAADGLYREPRAIVSIEDNQGKIIESQKPEAVLALPANTARLISSILSDNEARAPIFGGASPLYFPGVDVAVKTGTTQDYRDAWIVGYTPSIVIGAWAGNNDNAPMEKQVAGFIVAPMWHTVFAEALKNLESETFPRPEDPPKDLKPILRGVWRGSQTYLVDKISGKLATEYSPAETREEKVVRAIHSILFWVNRNDPRGADPENPDADPQFKLWETPIRTWAQSQGLADQTTEVIPKETDDLHRPEYFPQLSITSPGETTAYDNNQRVVVSIQSQGRFPIVEATFYLNGFFLGSSRVPPFNFSFIPAEVPEPRKDNELLVEVFDSVRNRGRAVLNLELAI
jgi:membrane peptidoglycan carboxypeptidase